MRPKAPVWLLALALSVTGCADARKDDYPLDAGRTWTYRMLIRQGAEGSERVTEAQSVVTNLPGRQLAGQRVVPQRQDAFGSARIRLIRDDGIRVAEVGEVREPDGAEVARPQPNLILLRPLVPGASWSATWETMQSGQPVLVPMQKMVETTEGIVEVGAGRFTNALRLAIAGGGSVVINGSPERVEVSGEEWFAPGVGLVQASFREVVVGHGEAATRVDLHLTASHP
ncbi:MAG: hypothetical protein U1E42_10285 [Rhodospirillales bacterium]